MIETSGAKIRQNYEKSKRPKRGGGGVKFDIQNIRPIYKMYNLRPKGKLCAGRWERLAHFNFSDVQSWNVETARPPPILGGGDVALIKGQRAYKVSSFSPSSILYTWVENEIS